MRPVAPPPPEAGRARGGRGSSIPGGSPEAKAPGSDAIALRPSSPPIVTAHRDGSGRAAASRGEDGPRQTAADPVRRPGSWGRDVGFAGLGLPPSRVLVPRARVPRAPLALPGTYRAASGRSIPSALPPPPTWRGVDLGRSRHREPAGGSRKLDLWSGDMGTVTAPSAASESSSTAAPAGRRSMSFMGITGVPAWPERILLTSALPELPLQHEERL